MTAKILRLRCMYRNHLDYSPVRIITLFLNNICYDTIPSTACERDFLTRVKSLSKYSHTIHVNFNEK